MAALGWTLGKVAGSSVSIVVPSQAPPSRPCTLGVRWVALASAALAVRFKFVSTPNDRRAPRLDEFVAGAVACLGRALAGRAAAPRAGEATLVAPVLVV